MAKSKLPSSKVLRKLLNETLPSLDQPALLPILQINDPKYYIQRAMELLSESLTLKDPDNKIKLAMTLLTLSRFAGLEREIQSTQKRTSTKVKLPDTGASSAASAST
jgi:hypothetical protein